MNPVSALGPVRPLESLLPSQPTAGTASQTSFASMLGSAIRSSETAGNEAGKLMEKFVNGEAVDLHTVALAGQKAGLHFEMLMQVRNKVVQAYQEIMRLQL